MLDREMLRAAHTRACKKNLNKEIKAFKEEAVKGVKVNNERHFKLHQIHENSKNWMNVIMD